MTDIITIITLKNKILERLSPFDIYGEMKKVGNEYTRKCPFHEEKTPSFRVNPNTLEFYCFGCGKGGDIIKFVMEKENISSFTEALNKLAEKAGVEVSDFNSSPHRVLYEVNRNAMDFYHENLIKNKNALDYLLKERALTAESVKTFHIGCTAEPLVTHLKLKGFTEDEIVRAGLGTIKNGKLRDMFWNRIMFPILKNGKVIGFGGRIIGKGEPKYLNSQTSPIFYKKKALYGFDSTAIKTKGYAFIVEGYMDTIMCHQSGFRNAVAPLGTSLTEEHIEAIKQCTNWVLLVLDGDKAGRAAAAKTARMLFEKKMRGAVIMLPEGEDPDSFLRKGGDFSRLIRKAIPFSVFLFDHAPEMKKRVFENILDRPVLEVAEFLAYRGTNKDAKMLGEIQARALVEVAVKNNKPIYKKDVITVKMFGGFLVFFYKDKFLFYEKGKGQSYKEYRIQADKLVKYIINRKERAKSAYEINNYI